MTDPPFMPNSELEPPSEPTEVVPGFIYYKRADDIIVYHFTKLTRAVVDSYAARASYSDAKGIANHEHVRSMYIGRGLIPTPYFLSTIVKLSQETPDELLESLAAVTGDNLPTTLLQVMIRQIDPKVFGSVQFFVHEKEAVKWLNERDEALRANQ